MSTEKESVPNSEQSTSLNIQLDSANIDNEEPTISKEGAKAFLLKASFLHLLPNLIPVAAILWYNRDSGNYNGMFINYKYIGNPYIIVSGIVVILSLAALSVPLVGRKSFAILLYFLMFFPALFYIYLFLLAYTTKPMVLNFKPLVWFYDIMVGGAFGLFLACVFYNGKKHHLSFGVGAGVVTSVALVVLHIFLLEPKFGFYLYQYFLFAFLAGLWSYYLNFDAKTMLEQGGDFYRKSDAVLGAAHFFTDFAFGLWARLFLHKREPATLNIGHLDPVVSDQPINL